MLDVKELIGLPSQIQIVIAAGFLGYMAAFAGVRFRHGQVEVVLYTVVFSVIASAALAFFSFLWALVWPSFAAFPAAVSAILATVAVGYTWRQWVRPQAFRRLRSMGLAQHDGTGASRVLDGIINDPNLVWNQIAVRLTDSTTLICENTSVHSNAIIGFARVDSDGNVAMVASHMQDAVGMTVELEGVRDPLGDRVTYIPAGQVHSIVVRLARR